MARNKPRSGIAKYVPPKPKKPKAKGGSRVPQVETIHLMQASLQFSDSNPKLREDLKYIFSQSPDMVGLTEVTDDDRKKIIREESRAAGYEPVIFPKGDVHLLVKLNGDPKTKVKSRGRVKAADGVPGEYGERSVCWVQVSWHSQSVWFHEAHWSLLKHGDKRHTSITQQMATQVKKHGKGDAISFFAGDINIDEGKDNQADNPNMPNQIFREAGLLTIFDEHSKLPKATIGMSVFDIVGSYRPDKQVTGTRYKIHPKQNSDHSFVSAWYEIDVSKAVTTGVSDGPVGSIGNDVDEDDTTDDPEGPDFYATGGNISWADYQDNTVYGLSYAYGDSDDSR